ERVPPNVSRAAARVRQGKGTSEDQKLLKAWGKRKKGGPVQAYIDKDQRATLQVERRRLVGVEKDWQKKASRFESRADVQRTALEQRLASRVATNPKLARRADRTREAFESELGSRRPGAE